ncbi:MAG: toxin co-regulated pilus biosynthesis Q family protein [Alphaproteobacteria bacterium]|nr:toxin co-regulated pilus biosynthesis Q family protein [Alphaproteobacteria bacterium]
MFRKVLIFAMFATAAGYCFAAQGLPQVVTSEVFYSEDRAVEQGGEYEDVVQTEVQEYYQAPAVVPAWPLAGSDADVEVACEAGGCAKDKTSDNIRIVSKIGADLVVENNFNMGTRGDFGGWSGGANMLHGTQIPVGFDDECNSGSEMPLLHREVLEDDGGNVLAVSRSSRKNCGGYADGYAAYAAKMGFAPTNGDGAGSDGLNAGDNAGDEIAVDASADAEAPVTMQDQVRSWVVANGQTLREVLQTWCDKEGWDLVWTTPREYPIEASAVFKGRFVDVASALVRNFGRATPVPYAKFYKGNRVLVISTNEE